MCMQYIIINNLQKIQKYVYNILEKINFMIYVIGFGLWNKFEIWNGVKKN